MDRNGTGERLRGRVAVVYGAAGPIGTAIAAGLAGEGARVYATGRTGTAVEGVAARLRATGGDVVAAEVDALDEERVVAFLADVVAERGRLDVSANVIGLGDVQRSLLEIGVEDFLQPIVTAARTQFVTTRAAARHMAASGGGVVMQFGGGGPQTQYGLGGFKVALDAMEGVRRQFALELGRSGVRVVTVKSGGIAESVAAETRDEVEQMLDETQLGGFATLADVAATAAFLASDDARSITCTEINISRGAMPD